MLLALAVVVTPPTTTPVSAAPTGAAEWKVLERINEFRADHGRGRVRMMPRLRKVAGRRSSSMARLDYFAHVSPGGIDAGDLLRSLNVRFRSWGEVIGWTSGGGLLRGSRAMVRWWSRSPGHRRIMLDGDYRRVGVGVVKDGRRTLWTVVFVE